MRHIANISPRFSPSWEKGTRGTCVYGKNENSCTPVKLLSRFRFLLHSLVFKLVRILGNRERFPSIQRVGFPRPLALKNIFSTQSIVEKLNGSASPTHVSGLIAHSFEACTRKKPINWNQSRSSPNPYLETSYFSDICQSTIARMRFTSIRLDARPWKSLSAIDKKLGPKLSA